MPTVSEDTLRAAAAEYAAGLATLDRRLRELSEEHARLLADRRVTLGAKYALDRLLESLASEPPLRAGQAAVAPDRDGLSPAPACHEASVARAAIA